MTDILERLQAEERQHRSGFPGMRRDVADLLLEAADEIERLRSEVKALQENPAILSSGAAPTVLLSDMQEAVFAEREACAKMVDNLLRFEKQDELAAAIRSRGGGA